MHRSDANWAQRFPKLLIQTAYFENEIRMLKIRTCLAEVNYVALDRHLKFSGMLMENPEIGLRTDRNIKIIIKLQGKIFFYSGNWYQQHVETETNWALPAFIHIIYIRTGNGTQGKNWSTFVEIKCDTHIILLNLRHSEEKETREIKIDRAPLLHVWIFMV